MKMKGMGMVKKLVILGAGVGGLSVVHELRESDVALDDVDITIIDPDFSHFMGFTLPWVMRGWREHDSVAIRPTAESLSGVRAVTGTVRTIDHAAQTVAMDDGTEVPFDALVIATGARNAVDKVPGLAEAMDRGVAVHYYGIEAAGAAHRALQGFTGGKLVFLITSQPFRCPVAPYEGALLAADLLRENGARAATQMSVYSPEAHPMPSAGPYAGPELVELLKNADIDFHGERNVERVDGDRRIIEFHDGTQAEFDMLVFIPPHEPSLSLDGDDWITVDVDTMQTQYPGIFAVGDATSITIPSGRSLPKAAIFARNGAKTAAENVLRYLGKTDRAGALSGKGYCYIDTGAGNSARGAGDFFTLPHPAIHLSPPSAELNSDKHAEEHQWRAVWECPAATAG